MANPQFFKVLISSILLVMMITQLSAQRDELFKITRNKDANEIIYHLNTDGHGRLDLQKPIESYWIRHDPDEAGRSLSNIERKYAYGLEFSGITADGGTFTFVSFDRELFLVRTGKRDFEVQAELNGKRLQLVEVYLNLGKGSFWFPKVNFIELRLLNEKGEMVIEKIKDR